MGYNAPVSIKGIQKEYYKRLYLIKLLKRGKKYEIKSQYNDPSLHPWDIKLRGLQWGWSNLRVRQKKEKEK